MPINSSIACLLKKVESGKVDAASLKTIKDLTDSYEANFKAVLGEEASAPLNAAKEALKTFTHDTNRAIVHAEAQFMQTAHTNTFLGTKNTFREMNQAVKQLTLDNYSHSKDGFTKTFARNTSGTSEKISAEVYDNIGEVEQVALARFLFGGPAPKSKELKMLGEAMKKDLKFRDIKQL